MRRLGPLVLTSMFVLAAGNAANAAGTPADSTASAAPDESAVLRDAAGEKVGRVPRVPWVTDVSWPEIVARADSADQPVLIDFTATWCGPCKLLDVMVFTEKAVIAELAEVVTFQVDIDKPEYRELKERFGVEAVPTVAWCSPSGEPIDSFTGYVSSKQFLEIVRGWRSNLTIDRVLGERKARSPEDPLVLLDVARRQAERGNDREAEILYRRLLNLRHGADPQVVARGMLGLAGLADEAGRHEEARRLAARVAGPDSGQAATVDGEVLLEAALFQESIGDTLGMLHSFRSLAERDHRSVLALHGYARAAVRVGHDLEDATRAALRATVYSDNDPDVISTLAACYFARDMVSRAIRWQEKAVAAAPHTARYREELATYRAAQEADPYGLRRSRRGRTVAPPERGR
jgi:thioredoxin-like negative regulator of GroEL